MTKFFKLVSLTALLCGGAGMAFADPMDIIGNGMTQNNIGTSASNQNLSTIVSSTVANGSAGNTLTVSNNSPTTIPTLFIGNSTLQQSIGNDTANQAATNVFSSSVANNAAGNAITFSASQ
jgi:hypothetical protein